MKCPSCKKTISWRQKWRFTTGFCSRKAAACPHCDVQLISAKWPHRLTNLGVCLILLGLWSQLLLSPEPPGGFGAYFICMGLGLAMLIPALLLQRYDVLGEKTK